MRASNFKVLQRAKIEILTNFESINLISQVKNSEGHANRLEVCRFHPESRLPNIWYGHTNKNRVDIIINPPSLIHTFGEHIAKPKNGSLAVPVFKLEN